MATATAPKTEAEIVNDVKVEDAGPALKKITITIPAAAIDEKIEQSFATLTGEAVLPGFRKGRVPRKLIERKFGESVLTETRNQVVAEAYAKAIEDHKIRSLGDPQADELKDVKIETGKPLTFAVTVEVAPEFELPDVNGLNVKKPIVEVTQKHIDDELARQAIRCGTPEEVKEGILPGDRLVGRAVVTDSNGTQINEIAEAVVYVTAKEFGPKGHLLGLLVDDIHAMLVGKGVGDTVTHTATIKESDENVSLRGKTITIAYTINRVVRVTPASTAQIVETYGMKDEAELLGEVKKALEQRARQEQAAAMREQVAEQLAEKIDFPLPERLSAAQAARSLDRARIEMLYRGVSPEDVEIRVAELKADSETRSRERLKMFFILNRLAEHLKIEVSEQEVNGRVAMLAAQRNERPEQLRAQLAQNGQLQQIALQIREHKALDRVLDTAVTEDVTAEEWNKLVEAKMKSLAASKSGGGGGESPKKSGGRKKS